MNARFGVDHLLSRDDLVNSLRHRRVALVAHPASVTSANIHTLDALVSVGCNVVKAFGPQHGMRGDKQDNMIESPDYRDPLHDIPVISLYGQHRRPTAEMLADVDLVLYDLQDVGCRIYTYLTTLKYFLDACVDNDLPLWVLDRPNPAGRPVDGLILEPGQESFVGCDELPVRHGMTVGELARWLNDRNDLDVDLNVIRMPVWHPDAPPGYGWPLFARPWINPSPNASSVNMARCFAGTVLLEGTTLSEGRGTTTPLEVIGAPGLDIDALLPEARRLYPEVDRDSLLRPCYFEPVFHKHAGKLCRGLQIHTDHDDYDHDAFKPYRLVACLLKALRNMQPDYDLWRRHEYEYEFDRMPIDVINGGPALREWVDDTAAGPGTLFERLDIDVARWHEARADWLMY